MPEPRPVLLPDFGAEEASAGLAPADAFVPFGRAPADLVDTARATFAPHGMAVAPAAEDDIQLDPFADTPNPDPQQTPSPVPPSADAPGGAAALQTMLNAAFSGDEADAQTAPPAAEVGKVEVPEPSQDQGSVAALEAERQQHQALIAQLQAQLETMQAAHDAELAQIVAQSRIAVTEAAANAVMEELAGLLAHPLFDASADLAIGRFRDELIALLAKADVMTVQVTGPAGRLDQLRAQWPEGAEMPEMIEAEGLELVATVDRGVLSTRLEDLRAVLLGDRS